MLVPRCAQNKPADSFLFWVWYAGNPYSSGLYGGEGLENNPIFKTVGDAEKLPIFCGFPHFGNNSLSSNEI